VKYSPIVPVHHLHLLDHLDYHICFAELAQQYPHYLEYFKGRVKRGDFVLLDTMVYEREFLGLEEGLTSTEVSNIANEIKVSMVAVPDVVDNDYKNLELFRALKHYFKRPTLGIIQGQNDIERLRNGLNLLAAGATMLGIPCRSSAEPIDRTWLIRRFDSSVKFHFFGASNPEYMLVRQNILGLDTAKPVYHAIEDHGHCTYEPVGTQSEECKRLTRPNDFHAIHLTSEGVDKVEANIRTVSSWIS